MRLLARRLRRINHATVVQLEEFLASSQSGREQASADAGCSGISEGLEMDKYASLHEKRK
jgi:hypothetical protein